MSPSSERHRGRLTLRGEPLPVPRRRPAGAEPGRPTAAGRHLGTLREQGFAEARQGWCPASDALVTALR
ncbi:hypothetical protein [Streptomyces sp. 16-176A]|uniref:hypothetical protein n=1 Tax=Streptomyces sp. 16-176A TaxID=2530458 RepID=UPI00345CC1B9